MKNHRRNPLIAVQLSAVLLCAVLIAVSAQAQTAATAAPNVNRNEPSHALAFRAGAGLSLTAAGFRLMPAKSILANASSASNTNLTPTAAGPNVQVLGSGMPGRLAKWTGLTSTNSFIGDSTIFEDKFGKVGIGTDTPTSRLTVTGMIVTTLGGLKFPDGTVQTTAGLASIFHDATLAGNGTSNSPLGVAIPLNLIRSVEGDSILTVVNTGNFGAGVNVSGGGDESSVTGGIGVRVHAGNALFRGGAGVEATGGNALFSGTGTPSRGGNGIAELIRLPMNLTAGVCPGLRNFRDRLLHSHMSNKS